MGRRKRAGSLAALFVCLGFLALDLQAACVPYTGSPPQKVSKVYDGDSLMLEDGTKVRLVGLNTPELGRDGGADEPLAKAARRLLQRMVELSGQRVRLQPGAEPKDRYGRLLAHVHSPGGHNLAERLVRTGLGAVLAIPPNLAHLACLQQAEAAARRDGKGIWQHWPLSVEQLDRDSAGKFVVIRGEILDVRRSRRSLWLNLVGGLSLRIDRDDLERFEGLDPEGLAGTGIEARGWIKRSRRGMRIRIRHPAALSFLR